MTSRIGGVLLFLLGGAFVFFEGYNLARTRWMRHWMDHQAQDMRERAECSRRLRQLSDDLTLMNSKEWGPGLLQVANYPTPGVTTVWKRVDQCQPCR